MTIKERLEAYRRQKHQEKITNSIKNAVNNALTWNRAEVKKFVEQPTMDEKINLCEEQASENVENDAAKDSSSWTTKDSDTLASKSTVLTKLIYLLYALLWITLYVIALEYEFGAVYFVLSALVFICVNTRSGPKRRGEPSAYSVFNPNCEAIDGTLDASQFENEIRYGAGGVR